MWHNIVGVMSLETSSAERASLEREKGWVRKELLRLALPAMGENTLQMVFGMADTAFLGHLSWKAMSGVGMANQILFVIQVVLVALSTGVTVTVANAIGTKDKKIVRTIVWNSVITSVMVGLLLMALSLFSDVFVNVFRGVDPEMRTHATNYLRVILLGSLGLSLMTTLSSALRGAGDTKTPMLVATFSNLLNILLDYAMIFGKLGFPRMETRGAALATVISRFLGSFVLGFVVFKRRDVGLLEKFEPLRAKSLKEIFRVGIPSALENLAFSVGILIFANILLIAGPQVYAGHRVGINVESLSFMPAFGIAVAITTLVGQRNGEGKREELLMVVREGFKLSLAFQVSVGLFVFCFPELLIKIFTNDPAIIKLAVLPVRLVGLFQVFPAVETAMNGALRGTGNTSSLMMFTFLAMWLVRLPVAFILVKYFNLGLLGAWIGMIVDMAVRSSLKTAYFLSGRWERVALETRKRVREIGEQT